FAFPVQSLVNAGVIKSADDLARSLFFPATQTNPNNYNKSFLNCGFQPAARLQFSKIVEPTVAPADQVTPVTFTIDVQNTGATTATGVTVEDNPFPAFLADPHVKVSSDDPGAMCTWVWNNPLVDTLVVKCPTLEPGRRVVVEITANATAPGSCTD